MFARDVTPPPPPVSHLLRMVTILSNDAVALMRELIFHSRDCATSLFILVKLPQDYSFQGCPNAKGHVHKSKSGLLVFYLLRCVWNATKKEVSLIYFRGKNG